MREAGFSRKRNGNVGSGPPLPDPEQRKKDRLNSFFGKKKHSKCPVRNTLSSSNGTYIGVNTAESKAANHQKLFELTLTIPLYYFIIS